MKNKIIIAISVITLVFVVLFLFIFLNKNKTQEVIVADTKINDYDKYVEYQNIKPGMITCKKSVANGDILTYLINSIVYDENYSITRIYTEIEYNPINDEQYNKLSGLSESCVDTYISNHKIVCEKNLNDASSFIGIWARKVKNNMIEDNFICE